MCIYAKRKCLKLICIKIDLALNNLQMLIGHKTQPTNRHSQVFVNPILFSLFFFFLSLCRRFKWQNPLADKLFYCSYNFTSCRIFLFFFFLFFFFSWRSNDITSIQISRILLIIFAISSAILFWLVMILSRISSLFNRFMGIVQMA